VRPADVPGRSRSEGASGSPAVSGPVMDGDMGSFIENRQGRDE
jgi:hypothetical protein